MRVHLHLSQRTEPNTINHQFYTLLERALSSLPDVTLTAEHPDIVHILGSPQADNASLISACAHLKIPTLLSPLSTLQPWHLPSGKGNCRKTTVRKASALHAWSILEERNLKSLQWNPHIHLIANTLVTRRISEEEMIAQIKVLYAQIIAAHDTTMKEEIDKRVALLNETDASICEICRQVLYISYLFHRKNIPQSTLATLSRTLTAENYDEDRLAATLQKLKLLSFTASLEQVMSKQAELTEGFMPVPFANDKQAEDIRQTITYYKT